MLYICEAHLGSCWLHLDTERIVDNLRLTRTTEGDAQVSLHPICHCLKQELIIMFCRVV